MVEEKQEEKQEEQKDEYVVVQVATQLGEAIQTPEGKVLSTEAEQKAEVLNKLYVIEKAVNVLVKA